MNRKKYITLTFILSLLCMNKVYASCTQEEIQEFKRIEDEYKITYEFNNATKDYTLNFFSPMPDKYDFVIYISSDVTCKELDNNKVKCEKVPPGEHEVEIRGIKNNCKDILKTSTLKLPKYNKYSEDELCKGIEEFVLCQPTYDKEIDYETFVSRINTYKKTNEKKEEEKPIEEENAIQKYFKENLFEIIIIAIFIILVIITSIITAKSIRKSRRLE